MCLFFLTWRCSWQIFSQMHLIQCFRRYSVTCITSSAASILSEIEMKNLLPEDFSRQTAEATINFNDQNKPSSSLSSRRSFSIDSPEYSSLLYNVANISPQAEAISQIHGLKFPKIDGEDAAITRAYLAVISSPSSSSHSQIQQNSTQDYRFATQKATAFRRFRSALGPNVTIDTRTCKQNMFKRSITFFRNLNLMRRQEHVQGNRSTSTQVHHMISERRRREKLNENFQHLRSLLPPGTKKDKASVLASTTEYLSSLKAQVEELCKKNEILEAQVLACSEVIKLHQHEDASFTSGGSGRIAVQIITNISESTSEARIVDLQVIVKEQCSILDLVIHLLEFLKNVNNVNVEAVQANTRMVQSGSATLITLRLRIQGDEWDESAFLEAAKRVVGDMAQHFSPVSRT